MTKRAVLYARVCIDDGRNLTQQLEMCREHASERGWHIVKQVAEQGAGRRPVELMGLTGILRSGGAGEFEVLVVRDPSRLSRELAGLLAIEAELQSRGVEIEFVTSTRRGIQPGQTLEISAGLKAARIRRRPKNRNREGKSNG